jgi:hypothetical protein
MPVETNTLIPVPTHFLGKDGTAPGYIAADAAAALLSASLIGSLSGQIETVANKTYPFDKATTPYTINSLWQQAKTSGSCTAAVKINGVNVTGLSAVACGTSGSETLATAANAVAIGDEVTIVISGNSACLDLFLRLKTTGA